jgi:hypothetical protein
MKPTRRFIPGLAIALLALLIASCGQKAAPQRSLADDVALRIGKADLLGEALTMSNNAQLLTNIDMDTVIQPLDEPLDLKAARLLVHGYADQATLADSARLFNETFQKHTKELAQMWDLATPNSRYTARFMDPMLSDAASSKDKSNKDKSDPSWSGTIEKATLELLNSSADKAALVKQTAELLPALRSPETLTTVELLKAALSQALARHPEQLKPYNEEKPPSPAVQAAIDRLQKALQSPAAGH